MNPTRVIERKRDGEVLQRAELESFLRSYLTGEVPEYQVSALLMAMFFRGLDPSETEVMVETMLTSGSTLDLEYLGAPRVDKHSTGGVGDKVSLVLAPLAASLGMFVPMMSGRGLGHTTGTLDKLEAIPGFRTVMGLEDFRRILQEVGCAMIGQTEEIAPLDRRLYALRDVTGTVPVMQLIAASIMSKKLAEGLTGLLLDVKVGSGAFIPEEERARALARTMVDVGSRRGVPTVALLTAMDRPLGVALGNGLETAEAIACLRGEGPADLRDLVLTQAAEMASLADPAADVREARRRSEELLDSGAALERFGRMVEAQGGDAGVIDEPERLRSAAHRLEVRAEQAGRVATVSPRPLGECIVQLGGGRQTVDQGIDPGVGFEVYARPGEELAADDLMGVVHARSPSDADLGARTLRACVKIVEDGGVAPTLPLVLERITGEA